MLKIKSYSFVIALLLCLSFSDIAFAYDYDRASANLQDDYAQCSVYYQYVYQAAKRADATDADLAKFETTSNNAIKAYLLIMKDRDEKQIKAKIELNSKNLEKILKEEGMDRLIVMYGDQCKSMMETPNERMKYWLNK